MNQLRSLEQASGYKILRPQISLYGLIRIVKTWDKRSFFGKLRMILFNTFANYELVGG